MLLFLFGILLLRKLIFAEATLTFHGIIYIGNNIKKEHKLGKCSKFISITIQMQKKDYLRLVLGKKGFKSSYRINIFLMYKWGFLTMSS